MNQFQHGNIFVPDPDGVLMDTDARQAQISHNIGVGMRGSDHLPMPNAIDTYCLDFSRMRRDKYRNRLGLELKQRAESRSGFPFLKLFSVSP